MYASLLKQGEAETAAEVDFFILKLLTNFSAGNSQLVEHVDKDRIYIYTLMFLRHVLL